MPATITHRVGRPSNLTPDLVDANFDSLVAEDALITANLNVQAGVIAGKADAVATQAAIDSKAVAATTTAALALKLNIADVPTVAVPAARTINGYPLSANVVLVKADLGLSNVDNTTDLNKPVSTATAAAIAAAAGGGGSTTYAGLTDKTTVDLPTINTPLANALAAKATPANITAAINGLVNAAPGTLDTLNELAIALGSDPSFATTTAAAIAAKAPNVLTGLSTASAADVVGTDTPLAAFGKLQAKWNAFAASVRAVVLTGLSTATATAVTAADSILVAIGKLQAQATANAAAIATLAGPLPFVFVAASRNLALTDIRKPLVNTSASNYALTIQPVATVAWVVGDMFSMQRTGTGTLSATPGAGVTINDPLGLVAAAVQNGPPVGLAMIATNVWNAF